MVGSRDGVGLGYRVVGVKGWWGLEVVGSGGGGVKGVMRVRGGGV